MCARTMRGSEVLREFKTLKPFNRTAPFKEFER